MGCQNCVVSNQAEQSIEFKEFYFQARFVTGLIFFPTVCVLGMIGNILGIIVMCQKQMRSSTNIYLLSLAISDCIKILSDVLYFLVILLMEVDPTTGNKALGFVYPYAHYIFNASLCVSAWLTVSVAFERYIYVCHPTRVKRLCSISRAKTISTTVFVIMMVFSVPYAMRYKTIKVLENTTQSVSYDLHLTDLWTNETFARTFNWLHYFVRSIIPLFLLIILNTCILYGIRRCRLGRRKHRITVMLIVVIIVFLICIVPDAIMSTCLGLGYYEESYLARGIREITDLLLLINTGVNFIIYCIFNTIFWRNFQELFCPCCISSGFYVEDSNVQRLSLIARGSLRINGSHRRSINEDKLLTEV